MSPPPASFTLAAVKGKDFVGRNVIVNEMTSELSSKNKIGFSLYGIRRVGKTSILKEIGLKMEKKKIPVIYVSSWEILPETLDEFTKILASRTIQAFGDRLPVKFKLEELLATGARALAALLRGLRLSAKVSDDVEVFLSYVRKESSDAEAAISRTFSFIEHLAEMTKTQKCILMLDEFPSLIDLTYGAGNQKIGIGVIRLLRTISENFQHTKLVISGSYRNTMDNLVKKRNSPFYKQLLLREVHPFDRREFEEFLSHYLSNVSFENDLVKQEMQNLTSGIPYNLQLLGREIKASNLQNPLTSQSLSKTVLEMLKKEGDLSFNEYIEGLTPSQIKVLKALSKSPEIKRADIASQEFMTIDAVSFALGTLKKKGLLEHKSRGVYNFTDNLFATWLANSEALE